jgi:cytochrome b
MSDANAPAPAVEPVRVWDVPTRLVHWLLVLLLPFSWWTAETGRLEWHRWSGYTLLGLVIFRICWGCFGSSTARFAGFLRGPGTVIGYLRGRWNVTAGHNPLGALSVLALLGLVLLQITLGLFAVDVDGLESGPLSLYVSFEAGRAAAKWHDLVFQVLMYLVVLHVLAVLYYVIFRRQNLVGAMFSGKRRYESAVAPVQRAPWWRLIIGVAISVSLTWAVTRAFRS